LCDFTMSIARSAPIAEEIVQSVFLRIWERRATWDPAGGVRAYLFAACRHHALDHLKHERTVASFARRGAVELVASGVNRAPTRPDQHVEAAELTDMLRRAVSELPERRRLVVILRWRHHMTNVEIARVLGISVKGVETQFARAIAALRLTVR